MLNVPTLEKSDLNKYLWSLRDTIHQADAKRHGHGQQTVDSTLLRLWLPHLHHQLVPRSVCVCVCVIIICTSVRLYVCTWLLKECVREHVYVCVAGTARNKKKLKGLDEYIPFPLSTYTRLQTPPCTQTVEKDCLWIWFTSWIPQPVGEVGPWDD